MNRLILLYTILIFSLLFFSPLMAEKPPKITEEGKVKIHDVENSGKQTSKADSADSTHEPIIKKENTTNPVSLLAHLFLNLYQKFVTTQDNQSCQFRPSCSSYSKKAFSSHDPLQATLMTSDRLLRCNPAAHLHYPKNDSGYLIDPVKEHAIW